MCSTHLVLALVVLCVGMAYSWDIAISVGDRLEFYTNGSEAVAVRFKSRNLTVITYDEVHNLMLFVDKQSDNDAICGYNLGSMDTRCFIKRTDSNIQDLAFDPATELLFFTDTKEGSINSISLKNLESKDNVYGNLLIKVDGPPVKNIAVDSCRGYIYWTNAHELADKNIMERARLDGSEREVVYKLLPIHSFTIDPKTHEYYYIVGLKQYSYYLKADLREENLQAHKSTFFCKCDFNSMNFSAPHELTVSINYMYWMNSSMDHTVVWQRSKKEDFFEEPKPIISFYRETPVGIAANYRIKEQVEGLQDCKVLTRRIPAIVSTDNSPNIEQNKQATEANQTVEMEQIKEVELFCVYGIKVRETSVCKCSPGYTGERCDVSVCENYCLQGNCSFDDEGLPSCRCNGGYSGERCEVNACHGYCLNHGECTLNEEDEPVCECLSNHEGSRCETVKHEALTNSLQYSSTKQNLTLTDLLSNWNKLTTNISVTVEVKSN